MAHLFGLVGFYLPLGFVLFLVIGPRVHAPLAAACGLAARCGLGVGTVVFFVGLIGPMHWYPDSNLAPIMGFLFAPFGFLVGGAIGFGLGWRRTLAGGASAKPPVV